MRRPARLRLTVCIATTAVTSAVLTGVLAPAAAADPDRTWELPPHVRDTNSNAPSVVPDVPPFGRKLA